MGTRAGSTVTIREAGAGDEALVAELRVRFLEDVRGVERGSLVDALGPATLAFVERKQAGGELRSWLAESEGAHLGVVSVLVTHVPPTPADDRPLDGYVLNLWVPAEHRSRGIGRALLVEVQRAGTASGFRRLHLLATEDGRPLYESLGFAANPDVLELHL